MARVALVTGGTRGIGAAISKALKAAGYKVAVPVTELRPGITIAIVEDPDGNWVEFLAPT